MSLRAALAALVPLSAMLWPGLADASPLAPRDVSACKLAADKGLYLSSGFGPGQECVPSAGKLTAFMMFVDFPDSPHSEESAQDLYDFFMPDAANWFSHASYGKLTLDVTADTTAFYRMAASSDSYNWGRGLTAEAHRKYIDDAISAYTFNGQGMPKADVLYIVPTASAKDITFSPTYMARVTNHNNELIAMRTVTFGQDAYDAWGFKVLNHETGHAMCLADYYPFKDGSVGLYVGGWSLMGYINGPSPDFFAWDKWRLGWLADNQIDCVAAKGSTRHVLSPLYSDAPGVKAVVVARDRRSALVAEARIDGGIDTATCSPGVLLYTVATDVPTGYGPVRVVDANPNTSGCDNDPLNDATLNINGTKSLTVHDFGVTVTIESQDKTNITITVEYK